MKMIFLSLLLHAGNAPHIHPHGLPAIALAIALAAAILFLRGRSKAATRR